MVPNNNQSTNS